MRWRDEVTYPEVKWKKCTTRAVAERVVRDVNLITSLHKDHFFDSAVVLAPLTQYFFYTDTQITLLGSAINAYPGGQAYVSFSSQSPFFPSATRDANFRLSGTEISSVPEPATLSLLAMGLAGMGVRRWRQRRAT